MTKGHMYTDRKEYVETILKAAFEPVTDFEDIKYARTSNTDGEYIRIDSLLGKTYYLEVTALHKDLILKDAFVVAFDLDVQPQSLITDKVKLREVAPLFR